MSKINQNKGSLREAFFVNQIKNAGHFVELPQKGDFKVDGKITFEVGGRQKGYEQIEGIPDSYIAADDLEIDSGNKIPLWLFGFLY